MSAAIAQNPTDSDTISPATLSPAQAQVIAALAVGRTITDAAEDAGLHRSTIYHWLRHEPNFKTALENAQREYVETLNDGMRKLAARALDTLRYLLADPEVPHAVRLRTALAVLQRPHSPNQDWRLPIPVQLPPQAALESLAEIAIGSSASPVRELVNSAPIARSAPCPCGSGIKYKRCCGAASPGRITAAAAAA